MNQRPNCQNKNCKEPAIIVYAGRMMCGECVTKIMEKINKMKQEAIDNAGL